MVLFPATDEFYLFVATEEDPSGSVLCPACAGELMARGKLSPPKPASVGAIESYAKETLSGKFVNLANPQADQLDMSDIASALGNICRFNGHTRRFYSVAEHSVHVARLLPDRRVALFGLLHDASEAYLGDVNPALKRLLPQYITLEEKFQDAICSKFARGVPSVFERRMIKLSDVHMLASEAADIMPSKGRGWRILDEVRDLAPVKLQYWSPPEATSMFMKTFITLGGVAR
jgi:hypothetical protein